jgi:peptidoglycan lytic transglycosylase
VEAWERRGDWADPQSTLRDPERNIQIGCWYLEKIYEQFRDWPEAETRMVAAYNAGPSRAVEWSRSDQPGNTQSGVEFINRIDIPSTRAYVLSIMQRYRQLKSAKTSSAALQQTSPAQ